MDEMLAIPVGRHRTNQPLLCAIMGVTLLLVLGSLRAAPEAPLPVAQDVAPAPAAAPILLASR